MPVVLGFFFVAAIFCIEKCLRGNENTENCKIGGMKLGPYNTSNFTALRHPRKTNIKTSLALK